MDSNYHLLISKINDFTRKYYLNKLLRGVIYTLATLIAVYLLLFLLIYYLRPVPLIKTLLFFAYLLLGLGLTLVMVFKPLLSYFRLGKALSNEESAVLIGRHFAPVKDKLLNTLQLKALADMAPAQNQLILAGIEQKIEELYPVPFTRAVNLGENRKYLKYIFIPLAFILVIALIAPIVLREGTKSLIAYNKVVLPPAPFVFVMLTGSLQVTEGDDLTIDLQLKGDQLPQEVYIRDGINTFKLDKKSISRFSYTFKNLQAGKRIYFSGGGFDSREYSIAVRPRAAVLSIGAVLRYPAYLKKKDETVASAGDLLAQEGTEITWNIATENAVQLLFGVNGHRALLHPVQNHAAFKAVLTRSQTYHITPLNTFSEASDTLSHEISVIADQPPVINIKETPDSVNTKALYFNGSVTDDYGFSALRCVYVIRQGSLAKRKVSAGIAIKTAQTSNSFFYYLNLQKISLLSGQSLEYYFEVTDNDAVNGPKTVRSAIKRYNPPTEEQRAKKINADQSSLKRQMESTIKLAAEIEKQSKKLGENLLDKNKLSFEDKKEILNLLEKQKQLEQAVKQIQQAQQKNSSDQQENEKMRQDLVEKQKQIDNLFNHILDPKTKALLEKLQQMMDHNSKDQLQNELSKMSMDNKSLKNELDRMLELYRQLAFEQGLQDKTDRLHTLANRQRDLAKKTQSARTDSKGLKRDQEKYIEDFKSLKKEIDELAEKNKSLERPNNFRSPENESQQVQQQQQQGLEELKKNKFEKAADKQEKAAKALTDMAEKMEDDNQQSAEMESDLNTEELRRLLQNLLQTSFDQEQVMVALKKMTPVDPAYLKSVQQQRGIKDNLKTIADSLFSLSKRIPQIASTVTQEMQEINFNVDKSLENLSDRKTSEAARNQQYTMTAVNNLSLMLNEALEQLEKNKQHAKKGGKGKGKKSIQQLQKMQEELNKNMQQAKQQMDKEGNIGTVPKGKMTENFARMAQQQQLIREALQRINREENKDGKNGLGNLNQVVNDMKITESDLLNKKIAAETMQRQQQLVTKLLEADQASREQDQEEKRKSTAGRDFPPAYQQKLEEFKKSQGTETQFLQKTPPAINYYYKNKISDYFKSLNLPLK